MRRFALCLVVALAVSPAYAQVDPGTPDTLRLDSVGVAGDQAMLTLTLVNDQPLSGVQLPLYITTDFAALDSVIFVGRAAAFVAPDDIVRYDLDPAGTTRTAMVAVVPLPSAPIPVGNGSIAQLYFTRNSLSNDSGAYVRDTAFVPGGRLRAADTANGTEGYQPIFKRGIIGEPPLAAEGGEEVRPARFELAQNYPNPFNPSTSFRVSLPETRHVVFDIFNLLGQRVTRLYDATAPAGYLDLTWSGRDQSGREVGSGVYFYQVSTGDFRQVKKMVLLK
jgi:hypothetical protein